MWSAILFTIISYTIHLQEATKNQGALVVNIEKVHLSKGAIHIALYKDSATFLQDNGVFFGEIIKVEQAGNQQWTVKNLDYGQYTLAVFYDINSNGKMDRNWLGIPTEPYAFAKKEPSKWRDPAFHEVSFQVDRPEEKINVSLEYWKER